MQHEVEICRSEQPFVIQSQCGESFTSTDSHAGLSPAAAAADDHPLSHDAEQPGPSSLSAQPADDVPATSVVDANDIIIKTAPPSKSMVYCLLSVTVCRML